ncbi:MAG: response regulator [Lachnospiraceae bacterium]|nr:response regulator [Lachnospiraceae bacterium]
MVKRVLFIGETSSFIVNAVRDGLKEVGFECDFCKLNINEINKVADKPDMFFIYADEKAIQETEALIYIKDLCMEEDKKIFLIGYAEELKVITDMLPSECLGDCFERPINVKKISDTLKARADSIETGANKKHILLVDDSGTMLRTVKGWLEGKYRISMVNSATSAISFLAVNQPDLVLLDYEMPVCSGPQMLEMIRSEIKTESIPVIFLTSKGDKESVAKVLSLKPQGYLLKSMPSNQIVEAVDNFFATQKSKGF